MDYEQKKRYKTDIQRYLQKNNLILEIIYCLFVQNRRTKMGRIYCNCLYTNHKN